MTNLIKTGLTAFLLFTTSVAVAGETEALKKSTGWINSTDVAFNVVTNSQYVNNSSEFTTYNNGGADRVTCEISGNVRVYGHMRLYRQAGFNNTWRASMNIYQVNGQVKKDPSTKVNTHQTTNGNSILLSWDFTQYCQAGRSFVLVMYPGARYKNNDLRSQTKWRIDASSRMRFKRL